MNPIPVRHQEILSWYREFVDPAHEYELIPAEDLFSRGLAKAGRSNCILDTTKLQQEGIYLMDAPTRIRECLEEYRTF